MTMKSPPPQKILSNSQKNMRIVLEYDNYPFSSVVLCAIILPKMGDMSPFAPKTAKKGAQKRLNFPFCTIK